MYDIEYSKIGNVFLVHGYQYLAVFNSENFQKIAQFYPKTENSISITFSYDGKLVATSEVSGLKDSKISIWDSGSGALINEILSPASKLAISPDNKTIATYSYDDITIWDVRIGNEIMRLQDHPGLVTTMTFSPNGRILSTGTGGDGELSASRVTIR